MTPDTLVAPFPDWQQCICKECGGVAVAKLSGFRLSGVCLECLTGFISSPVVERMRSAGQWRLPYLAVFDSPFQTPA